jgi:fluoroacetyl-CoA thioesterase
MNATELRVGLVSEATFDVNPAYSAIKLGSGTLDVLGTPAIVMMVEKICREMIDPLLDSGQTSVGSMLNIRHLAPTPIGDAIQLRSEIILFEKNIVEFKISIWDSAELIAEVDHRRVIIDIDRFLKKVRSKPTRNA